MFQYHHLVVRSYYFVRSDMNIPKPTHLIRLGEVEEEVYLSPQVSRDLESDVQAVRQHSLAMAGKRFRRVYGGLHGHWRLPRVIDLDKLDIVPLNQMREDV